MSNSLDKDGVEVRLVPYPSTMTTVKNTMVKTNYVRYDGLQYLKNPYKSHSFGAYIAEPISSIYDKEIYTNNTLLSDKYKILWTPGIGLYNLYYLSFTQLFEILEDKRDVLLLINKGSIGFEGEMEYFKFVLRWLDSIGIEWEFFSPPDKFYAKNFYKADHEVISRDMMDKVHNFFQKFVVDKTVKPYKKVYVSRRQIASRNYNFIKPGLSHNNDDRLLDHDVLESFLKKQGFEIIIPEEKFEKFEDQINYFNSVKVLASLSSSGISNSIFMQPNTTIVEFMTTYPTGITPPDKDGMTEGSENVHHLYHAQAYLKNHTYVGIPNYTRFSKEIINKIKEDEFLSYLFSEGTK